MGLSRFTDGSPQHWKEKYFKLLDSQEQFEKEQAATPDLLRKAIIRLSIAAKGFDKSLDPHLERICDSIKSNLSSQRLRKELDAFADALKAVEGQPGKNRVDASILFEFLAKRYPERLTRLERVRERWRQQDLADSQSLFVALSEVIDEQDDDVVGRLAWSDYKIISENMIRLLDNPNLPKLFAEEAKQLKTRILNEQALGPIFADTIELLLTIEKHVQSEQQEMADFLSKLTDDLTSLGERASGVHTANENALKKRDNFDRDVAEQMVDLRRKSAVATQLEPLKQLVSMRLQSISEQIHKHNLEEQAEREKNKRELASLMEKIKDMETESIELKAKLVEAQKKAAYDPLTNLPNRQAFKERLSQEIARAKRYGIPLCLAVWDIDYFKNINDTYGHRSGDKALIIIAKLFSKYCREADFVARFGGEEFITLLPETNANDALLVVDKLRKIVGKCGFKANGDNISITLSCGLTQFVETDSADSFFERADRALYQAKQSGRNQCVVL